MLPLLNIDGNAILLMILALNSPAIIALIIGLALLRKKPKTAKGFLIFAVIFLIVGWGACGILAGS